jgi:hypothetical protein
MTINDDLTRARGAVRSLESAVRGLRTQLGAHIDVQRLADDIERCASDLSRLEQQAGTFRQTPERPLVVIPDGEYDTSMWSEGDVDAEGLGVPGRRAP